MSRSIIVISSVYLFLPLSVCKYELTVGPMHRPCIILNLQQRCILTIRRQGPIAVFRDFVSRTQPHPSISLFSICRVVSARFSHGGNLFPRERPSGCMAILESRESEGKSWDLKPQLKNLKRVFTTPSVMWSSGHTAQ